MQLPTPIPFESTRPHTAARWFTFAKVGAWYLAIAAIIFALADHWAWSLSQNGDGDPSTIRSLHDLSIFTRGSSPFMLFGPEQIGQFGHFDAGYDLFRAVEPILLIIGLILVLKGSRVGSTVILAIQALLGVFAAVRIFIPSDRVDSVTAFLFYSMRHDVAGPQVKYLALEWLGMALAIASMVVIFIGLRHAPRPVPKATREQVTAVRTQQDQEWRVAEIQKWDEAYRLAHDGQAPPAGFMPPIAAQPPHKGTNVMAILSLIFGIGGGVLGVVFGHVALNQIKRTGESGRGLAIAGLVLGYIGLAILIAWVIFVVILANSDPSSY